MEEVNWKLQYLIKNRFRSQIFFAREISMSELRISQIIHNRRKPTDDEKRIIAEKLGCEVSKIFPA